MFIGNQPKAQLDLYIDLLQRIGSLSNLFSNSSVPYLNYRVAENIFCKAFEAENHSRSDTSADASKNKMGVGLKTFINQKGQSWQKVAEFNKDRQDYASLKDTPEEFARVVSKLRNTRIDVAKSAHNLDNVIYHCVTRSVNKFFVFEEKMNYIAIDDIRLTSVKDNNIYFSDGIDNYKFDISKSTLSKRFITQNEISFPVGIIDDPYEFLSGLEKLIETDETNLVKESIVLPLFSHTIEKGNFVPERSGLNQWNADGRPRDEKEVYIRIPSWIHREFPNFFPPRGDSFSLSLPNGDVLSAGVFQDGGKALMSNPNKALGNWLIDEVLKLETGKIVTYQDLLDVGFDSVEVQKIDNQTYEIDFKSVGTYENFEMLNRQG